MSFVVRPALRPLAAAAALVALIALAYAGSLRGGFLWDDDLHITANATVVGPLGLREIWTTSAANYFPLVLTNFWVQHALWGVEPFGYRVVTLAFHVLAALLLWRVLRQLRVSGAWLGAALWALHPVQVESVAWICELKNTQSAVFFLLATGAFVRWLDAPAATPAGRRDYAFALVFFVGALLSKPSVVMLPPVLGLIAWWRRGAVTRRDAVALAPFFALSALVAGWTIWEQKFHSGAIGPEWSQTGPERLIIAGRALWFYLGKLLWPEPLIFIYPRWTIDAMQPLAWVPVVAAAGGLAFLWWRRATAWRPVFLAAATFALLLFPVLGFFSVYFFRYSFVGDHFQYLASMGPLVLLGAAFATAAARWPATRATVLAAAGAVVLAFGGLAWRHTATFANNVALWQATLARNPTCLMAQLNLGDHLATLGRRDEAVAAYTRALTLSPDNAEAHNDLGALFVLLHRTDEAIRHLERAARLKPDGVETQNNLGNALRQAGRSAEAIACYRRALALKPDYAEAHNNLGAELAEAGRPADAQPHLEAAVRARPDNTGALANLGHVLRDLGRTDEAVACYRRALALRPDWAETRANLGRALAEGGRPAEAIAELEQALRLKPDLGAAHGMLGNVLAASGRLTEALPHLAEAVRLDPQVAAAHLNLGQAYLAAQRWADAIPPLERATQLAPTNAEAWRQLAVALVNAGRLAEAVPHFEAALRLAPDSAEGHEQFGQTLRALGREREAAAHLARAAQLPRR